MPQLLIAVPLQLACWLGAVWLGWNLTGRPDHTDDGADILVVQFFGWLVQALALLVLGVAGMISPAPLLAVVVLPLVAQVLDRRRFFPWVRSQIAVYRQLLNRWQWPTVLLLLALLFIVVQLCVPVFFFDTVFYGYGLPLYWLGEGRVHTPMPDCFSYLAVPERMHTLWSLGLAGASMADLDLLLAVIATILLLGRFAVRALHLSPWWAKLAMVSIAITPAIWELLLLRKDDIYTLWAATVVLSCCFEARRPQAHQRSFFLCCAAAGALVALKQPHTLAYAVAACALALYSPHRRGHDQVCVLSQGKHPPADQDPIEERRRRTLGGGVADAASATSPPAVSQGTGGSALAGRSSWLLGLGGVALALVMIIPWFAFTWIDTGHPLTGAAPYLGDRPVASNRWVSVYRDAEPFWASRSPLPEDLLHAFGRFYNPATRHFAGNLGVLLLFAFPVALLFSRRPATSMLWIVGMLGWYFTLRLPRFAIILVPLAVVILVEVLARSSRPKLALLLVSAALVLNLTGYLTHPVTGTALLNHSGLPLSVDSDLVLYPSSFDICRLANTTLDHTSTRVLFIGECRYYPCKLRFEYWNPHFLHPFERLRHAEAPETTWRRVVSQGAFTHAIYTPAELRRLFTWSDTMVRRFESWLSANSRILARRGHGSDTTFLLELRLTSPHDGDTQAHRLGALPVLDQALREGVGILRLQVDVGASEQVAAQRIGQVELQ